MSYIDLTHPLTTSMPTYPNADELSPQLVQMASVDKNDYSAWRLTMDMHVGTHIDAPAHMIAGGKKLSDFSVDHFCGNALLIDVRDREVVSEHELIRYDIEPGMILLFYTGFDQYFYTDAERYFKQHPVLSEGAAQWIINKQVKMIGFDMPSPDRFPFAIHRQLFANNMLIIENLTNLDKLLNSMSIEVYALPISCAVDGAPARVIAKIKR